MPEKVQDMGPCENASGRANKHGLRNVAMKG